MEGTATAGALPNQSLNSSENGSPERADRTPLLCSSLQHQCRRRLHITANNLLAAHNFLFTAGMLLQGSMAVRVPAQLLLFTDSFQQQLSH